MANAPRAEEAQSLEPPSAEPGRVEAEPTSAAAAQGRAHPRRPSRFEAADAAEAAAPSNWEAEDLPSLSGEYDSSSDIDPEAWANTQAKAGEFFHAVMADFGPELIAELEARGHGEEGGELGVVTASSSLTGPSTTPSWPRGDWVRSVAPPSVHEMWANEAEAWKAHFEAGMGAQRGLAQLKADLERVIEVVTKTLPETSHISLPSALFVSSSGSSSLFLSWSFAWQRLQALSADKDGWLRWQFSERGGLQRLRDAQAAQLEEANARAARAESRVSQLANDVARAAARALTAEVAKREADERAARADAAETRAARAEARAFTAEARVVELETLLAQAEARAAQADTRATQAETQATQATERAAQAEA